LYYWSADRRVLRVTLRTTAGDAEIGEPELVFPMTEPLDQNFTFEGSSPPYVVLPQGEGYVRVHMAGSTVDDPLHVILNWRNAINWRD
jgi:hypothetical protein